MKNNLISNTFAGLVLPALFAVAIVVMPIAVHAQEFGDSGYGGCCDFGSTDYGSADYSSSPTDYGSAYYSPTDYGSAYYSPTDYGSAYYSPTDYGSAYYSPTDYSYPTSYDYSTPGYSYPSSYSTPSYSYGGYSTPSYSYPYSYSTPSYSYPSFPAITPPSNSNTNVIDNGNSVTNVNTNVNTNTCSASNSCNTTITTDSHNIVSNPAPVINNVISNPAPVTPVVYNNTPTYPVYPNYPTYNYPTCTLTVSPSTIVHGQPATLSWSSSYANSGWVSMVGNVGPSGSIQVNPGVSQTYNATFYGYNGQQATCSAYVNVAAPIAYNNTPYITLSAVPYTGLDLGPWGTAFYWGFLVVWCLIAAYLIVVKRVQNSIARTFNTFLFGSAKVTEAEESHAAPAAHAAPAHAVHVAHVVHAPAVQKGEYVDEFLLSQIHRAARA